MTFGAGLAGVGGAQLSVGYVESWFDDMTNGYGFVAVAVVLFAAWRPLGVLLGSYVFGLRWPRPRSSRPTGSPVNQYLLDSMPYLVTIVALVALARRGGSKAPEGLRRALTNTELAVRSHDRGLQHRPQHRARRAFAGNQPAAPTKEENDARTDCTHPEGPAPTAPRCLHGGGRSARSPSPGWGPSTPPRPPPRRGPSTTPSRGKVPPRSASSWSGEESDQGYNQAVYEAAKATASRGVKVQAVYAANIPETTQVTATMQSWSDEGVKVIFATSYGYYPFALAFAKSHPSVVVLHQGGLQRREDPGNFGTYWGEAFEPVSLGGMAAGAVTKSNKLGFVYAFPIRQTIDNVDAFELGAQLVNPKAVTYTGPPRSGATR